jgi:transposase
MAAPYSLDLRKEVVACYESGGISQSKLASLFGIGENTVKRYLKLAREKGDLSPLLEGKGRPAIIDANGFETIKQLVKENPSITLKELSTQYYKKHKRHAGRSVLSRACQKLKLFRKKLSIYAAERDRDEVKKKRRLPKRNS